MLDRNAFALARLETSYSSDLCNSRRASHEAFLFRDLEDILHGLARPVRIIRRRIFVSVLE